MSVKSFCSSSYYVESVYNISSWADQTANCEMECSEKRCLQPLTPPDQICSTENVSLLLHSEHFSEKISPCEITKGPFVKRYLISHIEQKSSRLVLKLQNRKRLLCQLSIIFNVPEYFLFCVLLSAEPQSYPSSFIGNPDNIVDREINYSSLFVLDCF